MFRKLVLTETDYKDENHTPLSPHNKGLSNEKIKRQALKWLTVPVVFKVKIGTKFSPSLTFSIFWFEWTGIFYDQIVPTRDCLRKFCLKNRL